MLFFLLLFQLLRLIVLFHKIFAIYADKSKNG